MAASRSSNGESRPSSTLNNTMHIPRRQPLDNSVTSRIREVQFLFATSITFPEFFMTEQTAAITKAGDTAPDFSLASTSGGTITLSAFRNERHVLLAFFPLAFTSTCTTELCSFSEEFDQFTGRGIDVLPISVDAVPSLKAYKNAYALKVDLLSDFKRAASRAYGVLNDEKFYSNRAYFLIDKAGTVQWAHVEAHNGLHRTNADIMQQIEKLIA